MLRAILAGAYRDETQNYSQPALASGAGNEADLIAKALVKRTTDVSDPNTGPLRNVSELVGKYVSGYSGFNGQPYDGFGNDLASQALYSGGSNAEPNRVQRYLETAVRGLADVGTARTWNVLIDLVAQTGRYPSNPTAKTPLDGFYVQGQQHCWVHLAIDRYTGQVIDKQVEVVKE